MIAELQHEVANYAHALDELNVPALEAILTQDTTWTFTVPRQGVLGPVAGRTAVLDFVRDGHAAQTGRVRHHLSNVVVKTADANSAEVRAYPMQTRNTASGPGHILFGFFTAMADTERENIREATLEGLDAAARKGHHGGRPAVITDDMLHTVLRRKAAGETVEAIQPDLIIPTGKRTGQHPSLASIYRALAEHAKTLVAQRQSK